MATIATLRYREFSHPNLEGFECPICHSKTDAPVVLVPIPGTEDDGLVKCKQVHTECMQLWGKMNGWKIEITE